MRFLTASLWALVPLLWGFITWLITLGPASILLIPYSSLALLALGVLSFVFYKKLEYLRTHYEVYVFSMPLLLPLWAILAGITAVGLLYRLVVGLQDAPIVNSLIFGVLASACIEELVARMIFVSYQPNIIRFIILNSISSLAVTYMHVGFDATMAPLSDYLFVRGHFVFSFMLGIIAYKTRRVELCILIHMLSNFTRYTLPVLIIGTPSVPLLSLILDCLNLLIVAGCFAHKKK